MFFCDDDDTAVIALWIISIGFVILAIDKTTKLSQKPACGNATSAQPLIQSNKKANGKNKNGNDNDNDKDDDRQFKRIEQQMAQLRDSMQDIKKNLQEKPSKNGGKKDD